jgi:hypothetical protein
LGLDPDFSIPIPLEAPPPPPIMDMAPEFPTHDTFMQQNTNPLLDENDQRAFSQFLDSFFIDQDATAAGDNSQQQHQINNLPTLFDQSAGGTGDAHDHRHPASSSHFTTNTSWNYNYETPSGVLLNHDPDQHRRSIIDSLDASHQQRFYQQISSMVVPVKSESETDPSFTETTTTPSETTSNSRTRRKQSVKRRASDSDSEMDDEMADSPGSSTSGNNNSYGSNKRSKQQKELLTEEEKRANHIASEQKRRNTIRTGFKELTDIIPTLKNINNSKSTILFKAVEYIRYLERRNRGLRERVGGLEVRVEVEGRMGNLLNPAHSGRRNTMSNFMNIRNDHHQVSERNRTSSHSGSFSAFGTTKSSSGQDATTTDSRFMENTSGLPPAAAAALLAHKTQQKQLQAFQEQLQLHQRLIAQQKGSPKDNNNESPTTAKSFLDERRSSLPTFASSGLSPPSRSNYDSISIPNNNEKSSSNMALVVPVDEQQEWRENNDRYATEAINIPVDDHRPSHKDDDRSGRSSELCSTAEKANDLMTSLKHGIATTTAVAASSS